ncbi:MAG: PP2C family protein-serine/threonine phosphatase, partial [Gammaproteobacteria bacterium]|nr:PP2C family protein-serine/threonine phosphatase [Gammaproteobacteria bacterium]
LRRELKLAGEIQRSLLPGDVPDDYPIRGVNIPARGVSGDFFDVFDLADGRIAFNIGDVSGKGINAALLMSKVSSLYRCLGKAVDDPGMVMWMLNREICETSTRGMFVTLIGGVLDPLTGLVQLSNAGHLPALCRTADGRYQAYGAEAPPLGISADDGPPNAYPVVEIELMGGCLSLFTDGFTECRLANGSELGVPGYQRMLDAVMHEPLPRRVETMVDRLARMCDTFRDDVTLVMVEQP